LEIVVTGVVEFDGWEVFVEEEVFSLAFVVVLGRAGNEVGQVFAEFSLI
jgi:hypothetical protein